MAGCNCGQGETQLTCWNCAGLIYRQKKPVHWSPSSATALAESELEYDENHTSTAAFVRFPIVQAPNGLGDLGLDDLCVLIWTTTPWTLPSNQAIAVNSSMEYCIVEHEGLGYHSIVAKSRLEHVRQHCQGNLRVVKDSIPGALLSTGMKYTNPVHSHGRPQPVVHADFVSADSGTGVVHLAPDHGAEDFKVCSPLGLPTVAAVDEHGFFTAKALPEKPDVLEGRPVLKDGSEAVLEHLRGKHDGKLVLATHSYTHKYPIDWRTKQPTIVRATEQWFAGVERIKDAAVRALDDADFVPPTGKHRLESFVRGRDHWCISRQRSWGVPIPALIRVDARPPVVHMTSESIAHIMDTISRRGVEAWWTDDSTDPVWVPPGLEGIYSRGKDTMDVWFDSGTSWATLGERDGEHLADVYLEGSDQHRGWFQSSLLTHVAAQVSEGGAEGASSAESSHLGTNVRAPFKTLITHGFVLDDKGNKMSKSLGNVVAPDEIIGTNPAGATASTKVGQKKSGVVPRSVLGDMNLRSEVGVDRLRYWVASNDYTKDVRLGAEAVGIANKMLSKYRITLKWLLGVLVDFDPQSRPELQARDFRLLDQMALYQLSQVAAEVHRHYSSFEIHLATQALGKYVYNQYSSFYAETAKDRLYTGDATDRAQCQAVMATIFVELCKMLAPVAPVLVEEAWRHCNEAMQDWHTHPARAVWRPYKFQLGDEGVERLKGSIALLNAVNDAAKALQERAREKKLIGGSLDCDVALVLNSDAGELAEGLLNTDRAEELAEMFVVSGVRVYSGEEFSARASGEEWSFEGEFAVDGAAAPLGRVAVVPAALHKCPRCWRRIAENEDDLCGRCEKVVSAGVSEAADDQGGVQQSVEKETAESTPSPEVKQQNTGFEFVSRPVPGVRTLEEMMTLAEEEQLRKEGKSPPARGSSATSRDSGQAASTPRHQYKVKSQKPLLRLIKSPKPPITMVKTPGEKPPVFASPIIRYRASGLDSQETATTAERKNPAYYTHRLRPERESKAPPDDGVER